MVVVADGLQPHNTYLYVLGNSGIIALVALLVWLFVLAQQGWKCGKREVRAALIAIAVMLAALLMFDSSFLDSPSTGAIMACFTLAACFDRASIVKFRHGVRSPARLPIPPMRPSVSGR
jgi:O-antigen ligase